MSNQALKTQMGLAPAQQQSKPLTFPEMLERMKPEIARALPRHLTPERIMRLALTVVNSNSALKKCDPVSVIASVMMGAQLGLEFGVLGQAYLIPYGGKCTFVPGWQGMVDLVSRAGRATVRTGVVNKGDDFSYDMGTDTFIKHRVTEETDYDASWTHVYAIGKVRGAEEPVIEVWTRKQVDVHLKRYNKVGSQHYALKDDHNKQMYGRKVALLQVIKYLPKSVELATAQQLEYSAESGTQNLTVNDVAAGVFDASDSYPTIEAQEPTDTEIRIGDLFAELKIDAAAQSALQKQYPVDADLLAHLEAAAEEAAK